MDPDVRTSRTDEAVASVEFRSWLADIAAADKKCNGRFAALYYIADDDRYGLRFSFEDYASLIHEDSESETESLTLTELLLDAEAEWRVDKVAKSRSKAALGITKPKHGGRRVAVKCDHKNRAGRECGRRVVPGTVRCEDHGGALIDPEARRSILVSSYTKLVEGSDIAVQALIEVAGSGRSELARVQAAKEILDRVGMAPELHISVSDGSVDGSSGLEQLRDRLLEMRDRIVVPQAINTTATPLPAGATDTDINMPDAETLDMDRADDAVATAS